MWQGTGTVARYLLPLKATIQRFAFGILVLVSVVLIVVGKADVLLLERFRMNVTDTVSPALEALSRPAATLAQIFERASDVVNLFQENERLRDANEKLLQWQLAARRLEQENAQLRGLLNYPSETPAWFVTGRVIGTAGGAFVRSMLINRGSQDGIAKGQAATTGAGLVGRVAEVGDRAARVLLVTDLNSRIPVTVESSRERAMLAGDNSDRPRLLYLAPKVQIAIGDRIVTSGHGGIFPAGIPVGVIAAIDGAIIRVDPYVELSQVEYVRIVDYGLSGVLPQSAVPLPKPSRRGGAASVLSPVQPPAAAAPGGNGPGSPGSSSPAQ